MEYDNLPDPGRENFVMPQHNGPQMYIAGRTPRVSAELQMHQPFAVGNPNRLAVNVHQFMAADNVIHVQPGHGSSFTP